MEKKSKLPERMTLKEYAEKSIEQRGMSRRNFLKGTLGTTVGLGVMAMTGCSAASSSAASSEAVPVEPPVAAEPAPAAPVLEELPIPEATPPAKTAYETDILVIGGGWAGITAAAHAKELGADVLLVDKGTPGYSGLMPWSHTYRWADPELEKEEDYVSAIPFASEFSANPEIERLWFRRSKEVAEKHAEWGFLERWEDWNVEHENPNEAKIAQPKNDRHYYYTKILKDLDVPVVARTMILDLFEEDGRVTGALGMDVDSGHLIAFKAKAVLMCMGAGSLKPTGFPTGDNTFDGQAIAYNHGLTIAGKEYPDFHGSASYAPGSAYWIWGQHYLEQTILTCGTPQPQRLAEAVFNVLYPGTPRIPYGTLGMIPPDGMLSAEASGLSASDPRKGAQTTIAMGVQNSAGGCVGMSVHKTEGVFCGWDKLDGETDIKGLWVVGDAFASMMSGATYCAGEGTSANMSGVEGFESSEAAIEYVKGAGAGAVDQAVVDKWQAKIDNYLTAPSGFNPAWARDVLHATLAPYWVFWEKTEARLNGALSQVEYMRDSIAPRLIANDAHEIRQCIEFENRVLSAEMTLRGSLERKESRGDHYRADYPYRDDKNFLCHFGYKKAEDGSMKVVRLDYPDSWKGDLTTDYQHRYPQRFPGETEALGLDPANEPGAYGIDWSENVAVNKE